MNECLYCHTLFSANNDEPFCCRGCNLIWHWVFKNEKPNSVSVSHEENEFSYLENSEIELKFRSDITKRKFKFHISGLDCISCVHLLEDLPQIMVGVISAKLDLSESTLTAEISDDLSLPKFCNELMQMGYKPMPLQSHDDLKQYQKLEARSDLKKLAIAGAAAGNIMLFTVPMYGGLEGSLAFYFRWISFFLFLPILFYSSQSFYKNAYFSLQKRLINVDTTIVIALWLGFILSTINLINGKTEVFFDSTASFIFLILCSRFYMKKIQQKFLIKSIHAQLFQKEIYLNLQKNKTVNVDQIHVADQLQIQAGQIIPCDAELLSEDAELDLSFLTGESWPEKVKKGHMLSAGSKLLSAPIHILARSNYETSHLGLLIEKIESLSSPSEFYKTTTDKASHWLTLIVLATAVLFFIFFYQTNPWEAFQRSLALLIVACPCAIAFGTPLALSLGLKKAYNNGFFIRSESFFERLSEVKKIIFDKTGTLTESRLKLVKTFPVHLEESLKKLILDAESSSRHPVALCLKKEWSSQVLKTESTEVLSVQFISGVGVEAQIKNQISQHVQSVSILRKPHDSQSEFTAPSGLNEVVVRVDGQIKAYLFFEESIRQKTEDLIQELYKKSYEIFILTGDLKSRAIEFSKKFRIPLFRVFYEQTSEMKNTFIIKQNPCLYVGDGLNDLLALKSAYVSYAIDGQFDVTMAVSDVYAPQKGPEGILYLFTLAKHIQKTVRGNLFFALVYNLIAGSLALSGLMSPLGAALLMPVSSTLILTHTMWRLK